MAFDPVTAILTVGNTLLDRLLPDKAQNDAAKAQLLQMQVAGELQNAISQLQVDQAEASSKSIFVAGWRPWVGWACGVAFAWAFIGQPIVITIAVLAHRSFDKSALPVIDMASMMPVLLGMLGMGALRSWDKNNGNGNGH